MKKRELRALLKLREKQLESAVVALRQAERILNSRDERLIAMYPQVLRDHFGAKRVVLGCLALAK